MLRDADNGISYADSAGLLGTLINSSPRLVVPYVPPILRALLLKLRHTTQMVALQGGAQMPVKGPTQPGNESASLASPCILLNMLIWHMA